MKIVAYYLAIVMLILFVGVVIYRLLFGSPCTKVGNYCVGDGWSVAGLAATILGVAATVLGILGAFALAAWWTDLDSKVRKQVDANMKRREEALNERVNDILREQELKISIQLEEDLVKSADAMLNGFTQSKRLMDTLDAEIKTLRSEYEGVKNMADDERRLTIAMATDGPPWKIDSLASVLMEDYDIVDIPVSMVNKYLTYIDKFLSSTDADKAQQNAAHEV